MSLQVATPHTFSENFIGPVFFLVAWLMTVHFDMLCSHRINNNSFTQQRAIPRTTCQFVGHRVPADALNKVSVSLVSQSVTQNAVTLQLHCTLHVCSMSLRNTVPVYIQSATYKQCFVENRSRLFQQSYTTVLLLFWNMSGTTRVSRYQKHKTNLDLLEQETVEVASAGPYANVNLTQTHSHASIPVFYRQDALPAAQPTVSKHWRQKPHKGNMVISNWINKSHIEIMNDVKKLCQN